MADVRQRTTAGNWFRYLLRFIGLIALLFAAFGLVFYYSSHAFPQSDTINSLRASISDTLAKPSIDGVMLLLGLAGAAITVVWIVLELLMGLVLVTGQRAAVGGNNYVQIGLAAALFLVVNAITFRHYSRYDLTRDSQFTLPPDLVKELQTLSNKSPTDVVVLQLHRRAIGRGQEPDAIDKAAELKVIEKVNDLVDQLRELGPRFRVLVLDRQDEYYADKVDRLESEPLRRALAAAPEDSIFFHANGRVRRMSFAEFFQVDKTASRVKEQVTTPDGKTETRVRSTNLVLLPQGREGFVRRILSLEQRKPKVGLLVIHPLLSSRRQDDSYSAAGVRKSLEDNGFEVHDIVLKRWDGSAPAPTAQTFDEFELEDKEYDYEYYSLLIQDRETVVKLLTEALPQAKTLPLTEINRRFRGLIRGQVETEGERAMLVRAIEREIDVRKKELEEFRAELVAVEPKYQELLRNEKANEGRRTTDATAKLKAAIDGCDLLYIPRLTAMDLSEGRIIPAEYYSMPKEQVEVIRDFIKSGKPVLACFGPTRFGNRGDADPDDLEKLFVQLGFEFGGQTILTDDEAKASSKSQDGLGSSPPPPPLRLDLEQGQKTDNPIRLAYLVASRSVDGALELGRSGPRAITVAPRVRELSKFNPVVMESIARSWNEERPVASRGYTPKYEATKIDDPKKGTPDEERRGPFPIGAALETKVPAEWYDERLSAAREASSIGAAAGGLGLAISTQLLDAAVFAPPGSLPERPTVRLVALGHGGIFTGKELSPAQEQLLLHTVNWQLGREEMLPRDVPTEQRWQFPRVVMTEQQKKLWHMGTFLGLPMLCAFIGIVVLMTRKMR